MKSLLCLSPDQLKEIFKYSFAHLMCDNSDLDVVTKHPFYIPDDENTLIPCSSLPKINYQAWQEILI